MKIKFKAMLLAAAIMMQTAAASAATVTVTDEATREVTVSGLTTSSAKVVAVDFLEADDLDPITDGVQSYASYTSDQKDAAIDAHMKHIRHLTSNSDYVFRLPAYGVYTIFVSDGAAPVATPIAVSNPNFINDHMGALTVSALQTNIDSAESYMRGELASYYALSDPSDKVAVATRMFARRAEDTDLDLLKTRLNLMVLLQNIKNAPTAADKVTMFEANATALGYSLFAETDRTYYEACDETAKAAIISKFIDFDGMDGADEFLNSFAQCIFLDKVKNATMEQAIRELVSEAKTKFGVVTPGYDALGTDTARVDGSVKGTDYLTVAAFVADVEAKAAAPTPTPTQSGGGGGGGGGGGASYVENKGDDIVIEVPSTPAPIEETEPVLESLYNDVELGRWSYEPIYVLTKRGVISGDGGGIFRPTDSITREEFVKIAVSAFGLTDDTATCEFTDVAKSAWSYPYIATAKKYGLVSGRTDEIFSPKAGITREEATLIMYNIAAFKDLPLEMKNDNPSFADMDSVNDWAKEAVTYLYKCNIIDGMSETEFAPRNNITREQTAKLVYTLLKVIS